jgi:hypothetical protein
MVTITQLSISWLNADGHGIRWSYLQDDAKVCDAVVALLCVTGCKTNTFGKNFNFGNFSNFVCDSQKR